MQQSIALCDVMVIIPAANTAKVIQLIIFGTEGFVAPFIDPLYNYNRVDDLCITVPFVQEYLDFFRALGKNELVKAVYILSWG